MAGNFEDYGLKPHPVAPTMNLEGGSPLRRAIPCQLAPMRSGSAELPPNTCAIHLCPLYLGIMLLSAGVVKWVWQTWQVCADGE